MDTQVRLPRGAPIGTVLVVEDELAAQLFVSLTLADKGFKVVTSSNATHAVQILERDTSIQAVFTDMRLPGISGHALAHWVREHIPDMPVIVGSGSELAPSLAAGECYRFFLKPYDLNEIAEHLTQVIGGPQAEDFRRAS